MWWPGRIGGRTEWFFFWLGSPFSVARTAAESDWSKFLEKIKMHRRLPKRRSLPANTERDTRQTSGKRRKKLCTRHLADLLEGGECRFFFGWWSRSFHQPAQKRMDGRQGVEKKHRMCLQLTNRKKINQARQFGGKVTTPSELLFHPPLTGSHRARTWPGRKKLNSIYHVIIMGQKRATSKTGSGPTKTTRWRKGHTLIESGQWSAPLRKCSEICRVLVSFSRWDADCRWNWADSRSTVIRILKSVTLLEWLVNCAL